MEANKTDLEKIKYIHDNYPSLHKAITGEKMNIFGTKNAQNDLVKLLNIKSQLKADKEELLELMAEMKESFDHKAWVTEMELKSFSSRIESLIQEIRP